MLRKAAKIMIGALIALSLVMPQMTPRAEAKGHKKVGFFTRISRTIKRNVKRTVKKTKRAIVKTGAAIENGAMDGAVKAKSGLTGKKPKKVWVKGHYSKHRGYTKGHFARRARKHSSGGGAGPAPSPAPAPAPAPAPGGFNTGSPLPPVDPALPTSSVHNRK